MLHPGSLRLHSRTLVELIVLLCLALQAAETTAKTLVVGGDHNYPPYEFLNDQGEADGYNSDLTRAIAKVMGLDVEIRLDSWDRIRRNLESGQLDAVQGMTYSKERARHFRFPPQHSIVTQSLFARRGDPVIHQLSELKGKEVIVQRRGIMHDYLLKSRVDAILILVDTHADALRQLSSGRHDYALVANLPGQYLGKELALTNIEPIGKPFGPQKYGHAVRMDQPALQAQISEGLAILRNTGELEALHDKWFGPPKPEADLWHQLGRVAMLVASLLLLAMVAVMFWNRMLRREVLKHTQELQHRQQQLIQADKMASLGVLVSGVAHEINNPTSLLQLNLPLVKEVFEDLEDILDQHQQRQGSFSAGGLSYSQLKSLLPPMLDDMIRGTHRITRIVSDLRDFSRQTPSLLNEQVHLNQVIQTSIRLLDNNIQQATRRFQFKPQHPLPTFQGNTQRIEQVVINLIVNACQALETPSQSITVTTLFNSDTHHVELHVSDQGKGIPAKDLNRLCDPFFTTKQTSGGTGLGLSVSAGIVKEHGGAMSFDSQENMGTRVSVYLPVTA